MTRKPRRVVKRRIQAGRPGAVLFGAAATLLLLTAAYLWFLGGSPPGGDAIGGPFRLTQDGGRVITDRDFRGHYLLIYFGYTSCPDVCPTTLQEIANAMRGLGERAGAVRAVFITVDPGRDTPAAARAYASAFAPQMMGLSGTPREIAAVERAYHVTSSAEPSDPATGSYTVDHTAAIFLMGPDGRFLAPLPANASGVELARGLAKYLP